MPTRCTERRRAAGLLLALLLVAGGRASATQCARGVPCTADAFMARLLTVADEPDPATLLRRFDRTFGVELARHTLVFVSALLEVDTPHAVVRFVRLGDEQFYPLSFGSPGECVGADALERALLADGWSGGRVLPQVRAPLWLYLKGRTQLTAHPRADDAHCTGSILLTYRNPK